MALTLDLAGTTGPLNPNRPGIGVADIGMSQGGVLLLMMALAAQNQQQSQHVHK